MLGALLIGGTILGLGSGLAKAASNNAQVEEKKRELERKKQYLTSEYNAGVEALNNSADRAIAGLEANIADTQIMRDKAAGIAGRNIADQQTVQNMQLAQLQVEAAEAVGSAMQNLAMSGTRRLTATKDDPTGENAVNAGMGVKAGDVINAGVYSTARKAGASMALARAQAGIQMKQSLDSANYNYMNATMQMEAYGRKINDTRAELSDRLNQMKVSYENQRNELDYNLDYMNSDEFKRLQGWSNFFDIAGSTFRGFAGGLDLFGTGKSYSLWEN